MAIPDFYPVPSPPPDEGAQSVHRIADAWIPIIIGQLDGLRDKAKWTEPPDDIIAQIDQLIFQLESEYEMPQVFPVQYIHLHTNSKVQTGAAIEAIINTAHELATLWRQNPAVINDATYFDVLLAAGSYTLDICHSKSSAGGILTLTVTGDANLYTVDMYNASTQLNRHSTITVSVPTDGLKRVNMSTTSKNASSSGYVLNITYIAIRPN